MIQDFSAFEAMSYLPDAWRRLRNTQCDTYTLLKTNTYKIYPAVSPYNELGAVRLSWKSTAGAPRVYGRYPGALWLERPVQKRQAHVHPVIDVRMVVVKLFIGVAYARRRETLGQNA